MKLLNTGELVFDETDILPTEEVIRDVEISFEDEHYIFIEVDLSSLHINRLLDITGDKTEKVTPFVPEDVGSYHKMYQLTEEVLLRLTNEMFDVKKSL